MLLGALAVAAEPPQTGPETEKRFPPLKLPAGFKATLFACDPLIEYPSAIALGPRANTLFVAADYMTGLGTTDIIQRDEIRLVEDTDGDGYADRAPVWADGFNSIQGLTYHDGTVFVMHAPYLTALRDTDGDGQADERKNLFKGFGLGPEEDKVRLHNTNGIVAGHDGWLYLALGDRGCEVTRPEGDLLVLNGGGILRCRPDGRDLHVFSTGLRNIYDVALDDDLNVFTRDNENDGGNYKIRVIRSFFGADHGYPYLYDERPNEALAPLADLGLGSSAGGVYYRETQFPTEYRGLYFCEWGRAVMFCPQNQIVGFTPVKEIEFASGAENDPYGFKPTDLVVDRDGSLLIADWADGQRPKRGRARIYRVQFVGQEHFPARAKPRQIENLPHDLAGWFEQLNSESYYERLEAQLAIERLGRDDPTAIVELLRKGTLGERAVLHYVWILAHVLGPQASDELFKAAQWDFMPRVQTQAIRALADLHDPVLVEHRLDTGPGDKNVAERLSRMVHWRQPNVTLDMVVALGRLKWAKAPLWMSQKLTSIDPAVAHAAQQTLRRCGDWLAVLRLLDEPSRPALPPPPTDSPKGNKRIRPSGALSGPSPGSFSLKAGQRLNPAPAVSLRDIALRAIANQPDKAVVDGLEVRLRLEALPARRIEYADVLSRVHRKPPDQWVYWGFRPAPRPANTVDWEKTDLIEQTLNRLLADPDQAVRLEVLQRMQREKIPTKLDALSAWLKEGDHPEAQALILTSLREHPAEVRRETLQAFVSDTRQLAPARIAAFSMWSEGLGADRESRLLAFAPLLANDQLLAEVLRALGPRNEVDSRTKSEVSQPVVTLLLSSTRSESFVARAAAIEVMANLRIADAVGLVPGFLSDKWPEVRLAAAIAAGQLEVRDAVPILLNAASMDDPEIRRVCLDALRQLREPRAVPLAVAALPDRTTQLSALKCLAELGGPEQAGDVEKVAMRNSSSDVLNVAAQMLTLWAHREGIKSERGAELERTVRELQGASGVLAAWNVVGPVKPDAAAAYVGLLGGKSKSEPKSDTGNDRWQFLFGSGPESRLRTDGKSNGMWVAHSELSVADPTAAQFLMSSNAPLRVWLNGKLVLERAEPRRFQPDSDRFEAELAKGTNRLLIELGNTPDAATEFHARFRQKSSKEEHERLVEAALARPGNVERGRKLFLTVEKSQCLKCHRLNDQGEKIGPELTGIGSRFSRIHIIESLLDPSRTIAAGFQSQTVAMNDGRVLSGLKVSETADTLVLADNQGKKHSLRKADIEESQAHAGSVMPDGLEKTLTVDEFVDLVTFLTSEKQTAGR